MDTQSITPDAKERLAAIILSLFLILINIGITPIIVDKPANEVSKKEKPIVPILSPINYMKKRNNKKLFLKKKML